jgi:putative phage-type endonuclease
MTPSQRRKWLAERRRGIGGSDSAAAAGRSRWTTRLELYLDKVEGVEKPETPDMYFGRLKEPVIRQAFCDLTGRSLEVPRKMIWHSKYKFMLVNLDGIADGCRLFEGKAARSDQGWGPSGTDEVPEEYIFQCQHGMAVTGLEVADLAVLIGSSDFRTYEIPADRELQELLIEAEAEFWAMVQKRIPPEPMNTEDVRRRWRVSRAVQATANTELVHIAQELAYLKAIKSQAESSIDQRSAELQQFMRDAAELVDDTGELLATWKTSKAGTRFDLENFKADNPDLYAQYLRDSEPKRPFLLKVKASVPCPQLPLNPLTIESTAKETKKSEVSSSDPKAKPSAPSPSSKGSRRKSKAV